jgi:hypothetical protein
MQLRGLLNRPPPTHAPSMDRQEVERQMSQVYNPDDASSLVAGILGVTEGTDNHFDSSSFDSEGRRKGSPNAVEPFTGLWTMAYGIVNDPRMPATTYNTNVAKRLFPEINNLDELQVDQLKQVATQLLREKEKKLGQRNTLVETGPRKGQRKNLEELVREDERVAEYNQLAPRHRALVLDAYWNTGKSFPKLTRNALNHQSNPTDENKKGITKESRRLDGGKNTRGMDNRVVRVFKYLNMPLEQSELPEASERIPERALPQEAMRSPQHAPPADMSGLQQQMSQVYNQQPAGFPDARIGGAPTGGGSIRRESLFSPQKPKPIATKKETPLELYGPSGWMTTEGRRAYKNNFGGESTEYSIGVKNPAINDGLLTHIPSIYEGKIVDQRTAENNIISNKGYDPETGRYITPGGDPEARSQGLDLIKQVARKPESAKRSNRKNKY